METISINGKSLILKYTLRSFFVFENLSGHPFQFDKLFDEYLLFYSFLLANNESFNIPFDEFIELCDEDILLFDQFKEFLLDEIKLRSQSDEKNVKKKTVKTQKKKP